MKKGMHIMIMNTIATMKNSNILPRDSGDKSLSRLGAQRMIKLTLNGCSQNWQRGTQSTSASEMAFKRHRRWQRSQSCFLVQMQASMKEKSPDDSASRLHKRQMSFALGIDECSAVQVSQCGHCLWHYKQWTRGLCL